MARVIDAFFIHHQGFGQRTDFQQPVPVDARPRQSGGFQAEHRPRMAQPHFRHHLLETIPPFCTSSRTALILIHDNDLLFRPAQIDRSLHQIVLPFFAAHVLSHLRQCRLPHVDQRLPPQMISMDFAHHWPPSGCSRSVPRSA